MPDENFELIDEIHEFLLPVIGFGALRGMTGGEDEVESAALSSLFVFGSDRGSSLLEVSLRSDSKPDLGGSSEVVFSERGCWGAVLSALRFDWSQVDGGMDLQRER